jgi:hypothetical protein
MACIKRCKGPVCRRSWIRTSDVVPPNLERPSDERQEIERALAASRGRVYGVEGAPERAALMGGKLAVWSEVGAGTEVELRVPARTVYATSLRRTWFSRLFASDTQA